MEDNTANPTPEAVTEDVSATAQIEETSAPEGDEAKTPELPPIDEIEDEFEGRKYKIPKAWKDSRLMHADYTRKTQELAEQRRQSEAWKAQQEEYFTKHREAAAIEHELSQYKDVNWYAALNQAQDEGTKQQIRDLWMQVGTKQERLKAIQGEIETARKTEEQEREATLQRWTQAGEQFIRQKIKDWGPSKQEMVLRTMQEYGVGSTDPRLDRAAYEVAQFHPAIIAAFHDAALYRQSLKKATETKQEIPQPVPAQRLGGSANTAKSYENVSMAEFMRKREAETRRKRA